MQNACVECLEPFVNRLDYRDSTVVTAQLPVDATISSRDGHGHHVPTVPSQFLSTTLTCMHSPKNDIKIILCRHLLL